MCSSFANQNGLHFNVKKTQCIMFHHKQHVDTNIELTLNGDILTWSHEITHLGHHFNCCLSFRKNIDIRQGCFIKCVNEICTEFAFAHSKCRAKLLQIYGTSFYGSNLWDLYKEFISLTKPGMWSLERFIMYHFKHTVGFYNMLHN